MDKERGKEGERGRKREVRGSGKRGEGLGRGKGREKGKERKGATSKLLDTKKRREKRAKEKRGSTRKKALHTALAFVLFPSSI